MVAYSDVMPGLVDNYHIRWIARNNGDRTMCATVVVPSVRRGTYSGGGFDWGKIFTLQPNGNRIWLAYVQAAEQYNLPDLGDVTIKIWQPAEDGCVSNVPS